jgi:hypothetical protein
MHRNEFPSIDAVLGKQRDRRIDVGPGVDARPSNREFAKT